MDENLTERAIAWRHTGDAELPYVAEVDGRTYTIRINDFPAEPLYTLLGEGCEPVDLEDWPPAWLQPAPPVALLDALVRVTPPRLGGAIRMAAVSGAGEAVRLLETDGDEVVVGASRRLDRATLAERPPRAPTRASHRPVELETNERLVASAPDRGLAVSAVATDEGDEVRLHVLQRRSRRVLAIGQPRTVAAAISPVGRSVLLLDENGCVTRHDPSGHARPTSAHLGGPRWGRRASIDLARGERIWAAASGSRVEVRVMRDADAVATVDLAPIADEVTAVALASERELLVGTARGHVMLFELLRDRVGPTREGRLAFVADAVDAAIAGPRWERYAPRVDVYDQRTVGVRTTWYFVADHDEVHHAQSGSDWEEHVLCAGHATFEDDRCTDVGVARIERRRLTERQTESYDAAVELAAFRAATARTRSASTVLPGADAIQRAFDAHFASDGMRLPELALHSRTGTFSDGGWEVRYRFGEEHGSVHLDVLAEHRRTNARLSRVHADGRVDLVGSSTEGVLEDVDRAFEAEVQRRFG